MLVLCMCFVFRQSECAHTIDDCAEERSTTNPIADDMQACKELYDMTFDIVAQKASDIKGLAMPEPKEPMSLK